MGKGWPLRHVEKTTPDDASFRCVIAGGGTGGHLFPGIAVAHELAKRFEHPMVLFVAGRGRMESVILSRHGFSVRAIDVEGIKGRGWRKGFRVTSRLPKSFLQSAGIVKRFAPQVVLGVGGYSSGPFCLVSKWMSVPTAIHEQNTFPGLTNRLLCRFVDRVFISFDESRTHFKGGVIVLTGNPVREDILRGAERGHPGGPEFTILVMGGSQGASAINAAFVEGFEILHREGRTLKVIHQTGERDYARVEAHYQRQGLKGEIQPFIQDMAKAYMEADLVIGRAGATTLFELAALGKPSILVPYPHAANRHQEKNAMALVNEGGAEMIDQSELTGQALAGVIVKYMDHPEALYTMGERARRMAQPHAARMIVDQLVEMAMAKGAKPRKPMGDLQQAPGEGPCRNSERPNTSIL
jgi:UDP-N-acetylglucosamine--N-acetylmuramyl-(pentapeptide) pyrophosphoryl-undecaprenol N-acetylglucosamine transferase